MFLNISNQNHNMNLGLTDEDIIRGVTNQMEEKLEEKDLKATESLTKLYSGTDLIDPEYYYGKMTRAHDRRPKEVGCTHRSRG